jgi:hypothetical protein
VIDERQSYSWTRGTSPVARVIDSRISANRTISSAHFIAG